MAESTCWAACQGVEGPQGCWTRGKRFAPPGPWARVRVLGNAAMSLDGRLALAGGARARLSSPEDKARVHRLRNDVDAIVVGSGTVLADDPELLVDPALADTEHPRHPLRVVLDGRLRTPPAARVLRGGALVFTTKAHERPLQGAEVVVAGDEGVEPVRVLDALRARGCRSVLVEGGGLVHGSFLRAALYDVFTAYVAPCVLGEGPSLTQGFAAPSVAEAPRLRLIRAQPLGEGALLEYARP